METNIVVGILQDGTKRDLIIEKLKEQGILIMGFGPGMIRIVTHLDISESDIGQMCQALAKINV